jgi:DNA-binding transcriptional regulator GbsR (MarR family)
VSEEWRLRFAEQLSSLGAETGVPRSMMLVLGWLVVCDPPEQTAHELQTRLQLAAGTVSSVTRTLAELGALDRRARAGDRRTYYALRERAWERVLVGRYRALAEVLSVVERTASEAGDEAGPRLTHMRDLWAAYVGQTGKIVADWPA